MRKMLHALHLYYNIVTMELVLITSTCTGTSDQLKPNGMRQAIESRLRYAAMSRVERDGVLGLDMDVGMYSADVVHSMYALNAQHPRI